MLKKLCSIFLAGNLIFSLSGGAFESALAATPSTSKAANRKAAALTRVALVGQAKDWHLSLIKELEHVKRNQDSIEHSGELIEHFQSKIDDIARLMEDPASSANDSKASAAEASAFLEGRSLIHPVSAIEPVQAEAAPPAPTAPSSTPSSAPVLRLSKRPIGFREQAATQTKPPKGIASTLIISPRNFEVSDKPGLDFSSEEQAQLMEIKDEVGRSLFLLRRGRLDKFYIDIALRQGDSRPSEEQRKAWLEKAPRLIKEHLMETLSRYPHTKTEENGAEIYQIPNGLEFWGDFAGPSDPEKRMAADIFLQTPERRVFFKDYAYQLASTVTRSYKTLTRILEGNRLTPAEYKALANLAEKNGQSLARYGRYIILGSGMAFHLANDIFRLAREIKDPVLDVRFDRMLSFLANKGIDIDYDSHQGAALFYDPTGKRIAVVMPSRADPNGFKHEGEHGRVDPFSKRPTRLAAKKNQAIPYEIDGPYQLFQDLGGFFNLLNELNSWRQGEAFDGGKTDEQILKILHDSYGPQAGQKAADTFARIWPPSKTQGISMPRLVLNEMRSINRLTRGGLALLGRKSLELQDAVWQHNFLRLLWARYSEREVPANLLALAQSIAREASEEIVRQTAVAILNGMKKVKEKKDVDKDWFARRKLLSEYNQKAEKWLRGFASDKIKIVPVDLRYESSALLAFAHETRISNYEELISKMKERFGDDLVTATDKEKKLFEKIMAQSEPSLDGKLRQYLEEYNAVGFSVLWNEFSLEPTSEVANLLTANHKDGFKKEQVGQLIQWALENAQDKHQALAMTLLVELFEAHGFDFIYPAHVLKEMQETQRKMNLANKLDPEADLPTNRTPNPAHPFLAAGVDEALTQYMFNGKPGTHRLKIINLIIQKTSPEELPLLHRKVLEVITNPSSSPYDFWVAREFLTPDEAYKSLRPHIRWGEDAARVVMLDWKANLTALEFVGEFYRTSTGNMLTGPAWGDRRESQLDAKARGEAEKAIAQYTPEQSAFYRKALEDLWHLLAHENRKVRTAALYAAAVNPVLLLGLEDKLAAESKFDSSVYRGSVIKFASMMRPGFSPKLDAALNTIKPTEREQESLNLRRRPMEL